MKFIDKTTIIVRSGDGGNGLVSFRTAYNLPKLGPDGGNGGNGGDVVVVGCHNLNTLSSLQYRRLYLAANGGKGGPNDRTGKCAQPLEISMPVGTILKDVKSGEMLWELTQDKQRITICHGGKRGYGNSHFMTATRQAPRISVPGKKGTELELFCELKLLADVGFTGLPNAGKSTLLQTISRSKTVVGNYPFTTKVPYLGVVTFGSGYEQQAFVAADLPGLIAGSSQGKGLGLQFLRHVERSKVILYVLSASPYDGIAPTAALEQLQQELAAYQPELVKRRSLVALSKIDLLAAKDIVKWQKLLEAKGYKVVPISSATKTGLSELTVALGQLVNQQEDYSSNIMVV